jgi:type II secretory pathway component PulC
MRSTLVGLLVIVTMAGVARADEPMYLCHAPAAGTKISVQFKPDTSIRDLVTWALGFTCKNIVLSSEAERAAPHVTIMAPNPVTPKQALALFVDALETAGLVVTIKADSILIKPGASLPKHCPDVGASSSSSSAPSSPAASGGELAPYPGDDKDDLQKAIDAGVRTIDPTHYELARTLVETILANPMAIAKGVRVAPAVTNGKADGFKLYAIRPSSIFAKLGLMNGDTLKKINGSVLDTADRAVEVYVKIRDATKLEVEVLRRGKTMTLTYVIKS